MEKGVKIQCALKSQGIKQYQLAKEIKDRFKVKISPSELNKIINNNNNRSDTPKGRVIIQFCCAILGLED